MTKLLLARKRSEMDMTEGSIFGNLLRFSLPLLAGNLFQQLYNMVDTWVIGQMDKAGVDVAIKNGAYAAVGSVGPIINILIGFFAGLATGAGVVISQYYGARDEKKVHDAVHTAVAMTLSMAVLFTAIGVSMTPLILRLMLHDDGTSASSVYPYAKTYLTIYFSGVAGLMLYNIGSGILRAVGDSHHPFLFLVVSAITNVVLDLLFVFGFHMGVAGVAYATVIAQCLSAVLTMLTLLRTQTSVRLRVRDIRFHWDIFLKIVRVGIPAAIQMALTAFSNVFVQSYIGRVAGDQTVSLGSWTTYSKIDQILFLPLQTLALAVTTFVGQNLGRGNIARAKKGTYMAYAMASASVLLLMVPILLFAPQLAAVFNSDAAVVENATRLLRLITPFYLFCCVNQIFSGSMRGAGCSTAPMIIMLSTFVGFRQIYLFVVSRYIANELLPVGFGYPAGWMLCAATTLIFYRFFFKADRHRMVEK